MRASWIVVVLLAAPAGARADAEAAPPARFHEHAMAGAGIALGGSDAAWSHAALMLEAAGRVPGVPAPVRVRGRGFISLAGGTMQSDWSGEFFRSGVGAEVLACKGPLCALVDLDVGYQRATLVEGDGPTTQRRHGMLLGPRIGFEVGSDRIRFRGTVDKYEWRTHRDPSDWMGSGGISLAVAASF